MTGDTLSLLARCRRLGLQFTMNGDRLHVDGPVGMATPELRHELRRHKEDIIRVLMLLDDGSTGAVHGSAPRFALGSPQSDANERIGPEVGPDRLAGYGDGLPALPARVSVAEGFDGGDVEQGKERPPIRVGSGDENFGAEQGDKIGVADGVGFPAGRDHAERLKRLAVKELADGLLGAHTKSLAALPVDLQENGKTCPALPVKPDLDDVDRLAVAVGDEAGWRYPKPAASLAGVPDGWEPDRWATRLWYVADACAADHPERAVELRQEADRLDEKT